MKIYKSLSAIVLMLLATNSLVYAEGGTVVGATQDEINKAGMVGVNFLKVGIGARAVSLGGAYTALSNDLTSMFWNPAGLSQVEGINGSVNYTQWFAGFSHNFAALVVPLGNYRAGIGFTSFSSGQIPYTTIEDPSGNFTYEVQDMCITGSFAGKITDEFSFGANIKYVQTAFARVNSGGVAFDLGTQYNSNWKGMRVGFALSNLGPKQNFSGQDLNQVNKIVNGANAAPVDMTLISTGYNLPLTFRAGIAADMMSVVNDTENTPKDAESKWIAAADFVTVADAPEMFSLGTEYTWNNLISLRAGYQFGHDVFGFAAGIGLNYTSGMFDGTLDYAISPANAQIGLINRISVAVAIK